MKKRHVIELKNALGLSDFFVIYSFRGVQKTICATIIATGLKRSEAMLGKVAVGAPSSDTYNLPAS